MFDQLVTATTGISGAGAVQAWARVEAAACARRLTAMLTLLDHAYAADGSADRDQWCIDNWAAVCAHLGATTRLTPGATSALLLTATALRDRFPKVAALFTAGLIDYRMVRTIVTRARLVDDPTTLHTLDTQLSHQLRTWAPTSQDKTEKTIDALVEHLDPDAVLRTHTRAKGRGVQITIEDSGMGELFGTLFAHDATALDTRLHALADTVCPADPRTREQRRADALGALAHGADRLACLCENPDCPAPTNPPSTGVIIHLIAHHDTLTTGNDSEPSGNGPTTPHTPNDGGNVNVNGNVDGPDRPDRTDPDDHESDTDTDTTEPDAADPTPEPASESERRDADTPQPTTHGEPAPDSTPTETETETEPVPVPVPPIGDQTTTHDPDTVNDSDARYTADCQPTATTEPPPPDPAPPDPVPPDPEPTRAERIAAECAGLDGVAPPMFTGPLRDMTLTELYAACERRPGHPATIRPAALANGHLIPGAIARRAAHHATIELIVHPGQAPPEPRHRPSKKLADFVRCRDQTCRYPGCRVPATHCDLDHTIPWPQGPTQASNLKTLCRHHHLLKTFWTAHPGFKDRQHPNGDVTWTTPDRRHHTTTPGSRLLFPELCTPTAPTITTGPTPPAHTSGLTMPRRQRTRTQDRTQRIAHERQLNRAATQLEVTTARTWHRIQTRTEGPPPF